MNEGAAKEPSPLTPLLDHLQELASRLRRILFTILLFTAFFMFFGPSSVSVSPTHIALPLFGAFTITRIPIVVPSFLNSFSTLALRYFITHEVPKGVVVLNVNVFDPILSSMQVSLLFSVAISMPVILTEMWKFISPALYGHEKNQLKLVIIPAFLLFISGAAFAYFVIIPVILVVVKLYMISLGIQATISFKSLVALIVGFLFSFGLAFELPIVMVTLTKFNFVGPEVWKENWRMGILASFIIALLISPGVTGGLIEAIIGLTLSGLYAAGAIASRRVARKNATSQVETVESQGKI